MTYRYSLRFDTGERRGETVPLVGPVFTIGRRPGNSLQVLESSISGRHAELVVDERGVLVRDLGSTNGTRVDGERVLETRAVHGDAILVGNVALTLLDAEIDDPRAPAAAPAGEGISIGAEKLARVRERSRLGLVAALLVVAGASAAAWAFLAERSAGGGAALRPVEVVPGNLLAASYSFEADAEAWTSREEAPAAFLASRAARASGDEGLRAEPAAGEFALHASPEVAVDAGRRLSLAAAVRARGEARVRLGLEFTSRSASERRPAPIVVWSAASPRGSGFETLEVGCAVPAGWTHARALVLASAPEGGEGGSADVDDVRLVPGELVGPTATLDEHRFFLLGEQVASLFKVDRVLVAGLRVREEGAGVGEGAARLEASELEDGIRLVPEETAGPVAVHLRAEPASAEGGIATMGEGGYASHSVDFEREGVTDLLLGSGLDLVRVRLESPATVRGRAEDGAFVLTAQLERAAPLLVQLRFRAERDAAADLAFQADEAERRGELGACLATWSELLDVYPYEEALVARAEETRDRLLRAGYEEVRALAAEIERARFFELTELFRECREAAEALAERYAGSEIEDEVRELERGLDTELAELDGALDRLEAERLNAIRRALEGQGSQRLADLVGGYIERRLVGSGG